MTVENSIKLLEAYKKQAEYPVDSSGRPLTGDERRNITRQSKKNYEMMKNHILTSAKYKDNPILKELTQEEANTKPKGRPKKTTDGA